MMEGFEDWETALAADASPAADRVNLRLFITTDFSKGAAHGPVRTHFDATLQSRTSVFATATARGPAESEVYHHPRGRKDAAKPSNSFLTAPSRCLRSSSATSVSRARM